MSESSLEQLKNIPLFARIDDSGLEIIAENLDSVNFSKGSIIIKEGDPGDCLYLIKQGKVKVFATSADRQEIILSHLEAGDHFGEMALLSGQPRSANISAESDTELYKLDKAVFDQLLMNNPSMTLTLTHLLSQRLKDANIARKITEEYYIEKFTPGGSITEENIFDLLKYAEDSSLTGKLIFNNNQEKAVLFYKKGFVEKINYNEMDEDKAMDAILKWKNGTYRFEPDFFQENVLPKKEKGQSVGTSEVFEKYFTEKLEDFIRIFGQRITQRAINRAYHKYQDIFDILEDISLTVTPDVLADFSKISNWSSKYSLVCAVLLRDIVDALEREAVGFMFWNPLSEDEKTNNILKAEEFTSLYEQAFDLV